MGAERPPVIVPEAGDHRFADAEWTDNPIFDFLKQSYLLNVRWLRRTLAELEGLDKREADTLHFVGRQLVDAFSPANFALTNPAVLREMRQTGGESLIRGIGRLAEDLRDTGHGLRPRQVDMDAFEVGGNIAVSPGAVVFQTPIMQLLQYRPATETVYRKPVLIVPPWINKFYILDLRPDNSFIRWVTERGYTVFVISWVNPRREPRGAGLRRLCPRGHFRRPGCDRKGDRARTGSPRSAIASVGRSWRPRSPSWQPGTIAGSPRRPSSPPRSISRTPASCWSSPIRAHMAPIEHQVREKGYLDGANMAATFNALRANDLIWHFVINNYLMGKDPPAFDLLYWNADSTNFPGRLFIDYVHNMYQKNNLARPGDFELLGQGVDLGAVNIPAYIQASRDDHIAPAASAYKLTGLLGGPKRFVLAGSGHIAGVINPPAKKKYRHWLAEDEAFPADFAAWCDSAVEHPGSWWPDWHRWLSRRSGRKVPARIPGDGGLAALEPAPGSYVMKRA